MRSTLVLALGLTAVSSFTLAARATQTADPTNELEALFAAAERDPAALAPLIERVSARIAKVDGNQGHALAERLEPFCRRAFHSPERFEGMERLGLVLHTVDSGELPGQVARRYQVDAGLLRALNSPYDERRVGAGAKLKVLDLSSQRLVLSVDRERFRLSAWRPAEQGEGHLLLAYLPVGLGAAETPTPRGSTRVVQRVRDPEWRHPVSGKVFPPGHPENVLGGYWIRLDAEGIGKEGIGLHGYTGAPSERWLGQPGSNGCVRLRQADIDRVYLMALEGTQVTLRP